MGHWPWKAACCFVAAQCQEHGHDYAMLHYGEAASESEIAVTQTMGLVPSFDIYPGVPGNFGQDSIVPLGSVKQQALVIFNFQ